MLQNCRVGCSCSERKADEEGALQTVKCSSGIREEGLKGRDFALQTVKYGSAMEEEGRIEGKTALQTMKYRFVSRKRADERGGLQTVKWGFGVQEEGSVGWRGNSFVSSKVGSGIREEGPLFKL